MGTIALPTKECRGVDIPDAAGNPSGEVIRSRRPGYIEVDGPREKVLRKYLGSPASTVIGMGESRAIDTCSCGDSMFPWQDQCGECYASGKSSD